jgi:hypothetical protein
MRLEKQQYTRRINVRLVDAELIAIADNMAATNATLGEVQEEKRSEASKYTDRLKELRGVLKALGEKIVSRVEEREVEVIATPIFDRHCVEIRRADTGEMIEERAFTEEEQRAAMQGNLPGVDEPPIDLAMPDDAAVLPFEKSDEGGDEDGDEDDEGAEDKGEQVVVDDATPHDCSTCGSLHKAFGRDFCQLQLARPPKGETCDRWAPTIAPTIPDPAPEPKCPSENKDGLRCTLDDGHAGPHFAKSHGRGKTWENRRRRA